MDMMKNLFADGGMRSPTSRTPSKGDDIPDGSASTLGSGGSLTQPGAEKAGLAAALSGSLGLSEQASLEGAVPSVIRERSQKR